MISITATGRVGVPVVVKVAAARFGGSAPTSRGIRTRAAVEPSSWASRV